MLSPSIITRPSRLSCSQGGLRSKGNSPALESEWEAPLTGSSWGALAWGELIQVLPSCPAHALGQSSLGSPAGWAGGIHTGKSIALCLSGHFLTGAVSLSPFGWHFSLFSQHRGSATDAAPELEDRKVQLEHCWETGVEQSKSYGRTGRSWSISPAETCVALVVISSSAAQQAPRPVQWRCKTTKNKQKLCSFCATNLGALLFLCPSTWSVLRCSGERQTCLPRWGYSHLPQTPEGNTPWLPRKALWRFPPSPAADNRRKCAHVTHVHPNLSPGAATAAVSLWVEVPGQWLSPNQGQLFHFTFINGT